MQHVSPTEIYWPESNPIGWSNDRQRRGPTCARHFPVHHCDCRTCNITINQRIALSEMKTYRCHKIVQAARVLSITQLSDDQIRLQLEHEANYVDITRNSQWKNTVAGDYYVLYEDGYASRSPAAAFEAGYTEVVAPGVVDGHLLRLTDAADVWADQFAKVFPEIDRGVMISWFANCIEGAKDRLIKKLTPAPGEPGQYRKRPVVIEAWKIEYTPVTQPRWVRQAFQTQRIDWNGDGESIHIATLEGLMHAPIGHMLIQGIKGELYACDPEIFAATYDPA